MILINKMPKQLPLNRIKQLQKIEVATIGHIKDEFVSDDFFQVNYQNTRFAGTAVTLSIDDEDSAILHYTIDLLRPHDVLVIDIQPQLIRSCWGLIIHMAATNKLVNGIVLNGNITDIYSIRNCGIPIAYKGITAKIFRFSSFAHGTAGKLNSTVSIGNLTINSGDALLVDECGLAAIPPIQLKNLIDTCLDIQSKELAINYSLIKKDISDLTGSRTKILKALATQNS